MTYPLTERVGTLSVVMLFLLILPFHANASANNVADFVQRCGVSTVVASAHVFYDHDKNRWKEYPSPKQIPANEEWSGTAYLWNKPKSPVVIDVEGLGEDFSDSAFYCFDNSGKLLSLEHEFRTAWSWGFTEKSNLTGQERKQPSRTFSTRKTGQRFPVRKAQTTSATR